MRIQEGGRKSDQEHGPRLLQKCSFLLILVAWLDHFSEAYTSSNAQPLSSLLRECGLDRDSLTGMTVVWQDSLCIFPEFSVSFSAFVDIIPHTWHPLIAS